MFIADTEEIATRQWFAECLVAWNMIAIVNQTVQRLATRWVRMDEDILVALTDNLRVKTRNYWLTDDQVIRWFTPDIDDLFG